MSTTGKPRLWSCYDAARDGLAFAEAARAPGPAPDTRATGDLRLLLTRGDLREAEYVLQNGFDGWFGATSDTGRLVLSHLWLTGRWSAARRLFDAQPEGTLRTALKETPLLIGRVLLELCAEFRFDQLVRRLRQTTRFRDRVLQVRADSARIGMEGGALDFAFLCAVPPDELEQGPFETVLGLLARNGGDDWQSMQRIEYRAQALRRKQGLRSEPDYRGDISGFEPADLAQDLAILSPYTAPMAAFLGRELRGTLADFVAGAADLPRRSLAHYAPTLERSAESLPEILARPPDLAHVFGSLGLSAEWASGFTLFNPIADLPMLARAAERWRRTAAGDWCYGRARPKGWVGHGGTDLVTLARAERLAKAGDPVAAARAQLLFWSSPTHDAGRAMGHLQQRFGARFSACQSALPARSSVRSNLLLALEQFHAGGIPSIAAAPLAVLASQGIPKDRAFTPR